MLKVPIPKDLSNIKTKVIFNLTKRQLICFIIAGIIGFPLYYLSKKYIGSSGASFVLLFATVPCFVFAIYEKNGRPLEKFLLLVLTAKLIKPQVRRFKKKNKR